MNLNVLENYCLGSYGAHIILKGNSDQSSIMLTGFTDRCRKKEAKKSPLKGKTKSEKLIGSFESKVIKELNNK